MWHRQDEDPEKPWRLLVEERIREAQEAGLFDNLPGAGRPIRWEDESMVEPDWRLAFRLLRQHGFAPDWIEMDKAIRRGIEQARQSLRRSWRWRQERLPNVPPEERVLVEAEWHRALAAFARTIEELNAQIETFNLKVPIARLQRPRLRLEEELARLEAEDADDITASP
ncbi:MAG: DUF1992 domain-containing protein [Chloroflexi bacterium]|nr:MAG: DUF1992 domain-containing protein [Chloroflexota bacterium]